MLFRSNNARTFSAVPVPTIGELTIANFNMERFFDTTDDPNVSDVTLTATAFNNRLNKASLAIRNVLHYPDVRSYLVLGINLIASCTGDYDPVGFLMWLPVERRYGIWDGSHCGIRVFEPGATWAEIVANPAGYLNAMWTSPGEPYPPTVENLVPWPAHPYHVAQVYKPQPA